MATKSLSTIANENHLRNEIALLNKESQHKDETIKKLEALVEKLQDDAAARRQALDAQSAEAAKHYSSVEALTREQGRLQTQVAQLRTRLLDQSSEYDLASRESQYQLESQRRKHDRDMQELRSDSLAERKKRDAEHSAKMEEELAAVRKQLGEKNAELQQQLGTLRIHVQTMEATEHELRSALSDADREMRSLRVELRRAQGGTPLITDVVVPNPVEKTIHGLERRVDRLKGNVIAQMEEVSKTSADKADFKAKCRELQSELDDAQRAKTRLELDKADLERRLTRRIDDLEAKFSTKSREAKDRDTAVTKASRAKAHMEDKEIEVTVLQEQVEALKQEIGFAKAKYDSVTEKLRSELSDERAKIERHELKLHTLESEVDSERKKTASVTAAKKQVEEQLKKTKDAQVQADKETDKLVSRVAKLEKNLRDMERAALKI